MLLAEPEGKRRRKASTEDAYRQSQGSEWTDPKPVDLAPVVDLPPTAPFYLMFHHRRWIVMDGKVVPSLARLKRIDAVNGVTKGRMKIAMADRIEQGWKIIPLDAVGGRSYCVGHPCSGGTRYTTRWEQVFPGSSEIRCNKEGWLGFLSALAGLGIIPEHPPIYVLERMRTKTLEALETRAAKAHNNPSYKRMVDRAQSDLDAIEAAIKAVTASLPPSEGAEFLPEEEV